MGCCRGSRSVAPPRTYDSQFCQKCNHNLHDLYLAAATHQTRGQHGTVVTNIKLHCPKCNTVNMYQMKIQRNTVR